MNIEFQENKRSKPLFIFEDHNDFIKREPHLYEELEITPVIDLDAVKTEQDEPNHSEKSDLNFPIETQLNFPIRKQANVLKTYARNKAKITKPYTITTIKNSDNLTVPELIENSLPNETQHFGIKIETIESIEEVDVKENITFEPFAELDIKENIVKTEENVVKQPLGIEYVTDNLINGKSALKDTVQNVVNSSTPIVIEDTNKISYSHTQFQLAIHTHNLHYKSPYSHKQPYFKLCDHCGYQTKRKAHLIKHIFARHMPKTDKKPGRKHLKYPCNFCNKKFTTKCKMSEHIKTHNGNRPSCKCVHRYLNIHVKAPGIEPFACNLCKHVTCTSGSLKYHMVKFHKINSIVYQCHHCQSRYSQKDHLITHLKLESDDYTSPYKCANINYNKYGIVLKYEYDYLTKAERKFIDNYKLLSHSYECGLCPYKCAKSLHLKAHIRKHKAVLAKKSVPVEKPYSCPICNFKTTKERYLNQHLKKNHEHSRP